MYFTLLNTAVPGWMFVAIVLSYVPLRKALAEGVESGESSSEDAVTFAPEQARQRFEHYELVTAGDGKPLELGRGAMGVTYKGVRRRSALSRDTESHQRAIPR